MNVSQVGMHMYRRLAHMQILFLSGMRYSQLSHYWKNGVPKMPKNKAFHLDVQIEGGTRAKPVSMMVKEAGEFQMHSHLFIKRHFR